MTAKQLKSSVTSTPRSATPTGTLRFCPPGQNLHRTLSPFCPARKEAIAQKQQKLQNASQIQNNQTYSNIVKTTIKETTPPTKPVINLTEKHHLKYVILILEAHIASIGDGRPYNVILQESLKANNIDAVIPNRDSQKIMDIYSNPKQKQKDHVPEEFLCESSSSSNESSDEEELHPPQTEDEAPPLTLGQSDNQKNRKRKKNSQESTSAPYNKQPRQERLAMPRPPNPKPSTSSGLLRTPPNPSSQEQRWPTISSEFQWTAPNLPPQEQRRPFLIIYRSRDDSECDPKRTLIGMDQKWIKKKKNLNSKPTATARLKTLWIKS